MAAALRLPRSMSAEEKEAAADALIRRLGLTSSADTPVGEVRSLVCWCSHQRIRTYVGCCTIICPEQDQSSECCWLQGMPRRGA